MISQMLQTIGNKIMKIIISKLGIKSVMLLTIISII